MNFNEQQKFYVSKVSKELVDKVKNYLSSISEPDCLPSEQFISLETEPDPEIFWGEKFCFGINLRFPPSKSKHVFMDVEVILLDKFVKISRGVIEEDFVNIIEALDKSDIYLNVENIILTLIEKTETI